MDTDSFLFAQPRLNSPSEFHGAGLSEQKMSSLRENNPILFRPCVSVAKMKKYKGNFMKEEYDFSTAEQGKFYRPIDELEIPVYLDKDVEKFFYQRAAGRDIDLKQIVDTILRKEMDLLRAIG